MADRATRRRDTRAEGDRNAADTARAEKAARILNALIRDNAELHRKIRIRQLHFANDPSVSPVLDPPLQKPPEEMYQSDKLRQLWVRLKSRLVENEPVVHVSPPEDTASLSKDAELAEQVLNAGWMLAQERAGDQTIVEAAVDGLIVESMGVLHWRRYTESVPSLPDFEYLDELPQDEGADEATIASNQKTRDRFYGTPEESGPQAGKYKERDTSRMDRHKRNRARAGWPYIQEAIEPRTFVHRPDLVGNIAAAAVVTVVQLDDYNDDLQIPQNEDLKARIERAGDGSLRLYSGAAAAQMGDPSYTTQEGKVTKACLWLRDEWYELACAAEIDLSVAGESVKHQWELVKWAPHEWGSPPFAIVAADTYHHSDPAIRYMPALEGIHRLKPGFDMDMALLKGLAERMALPERYIVRGPNGESLQSEDGELITLSRDAANTMEFPAGWKIETLPNEINPALVRAAEMRIEEFQAAEPDTGHAEVGTSPQPWTVRLLQSEANVQPRKYINAIARAGRKMERAILKDMSIQEEPIWVFKRGEDGNEDPKTVVGIEPERINGLMVNVDIQPMSSQEQIATEQHGLTLLNNAGADGAPRPLITTEDYIEKFMNLPNAQEQLVKLESEYVYNTYFRKQIVAQQVAKQLGWKLVIGPGGDNIGLGGQPVSDQQTLAMSDTPQLAGMAAPPPPPAAPPQPQADAAQMPQLPGLAVQGTQAIGGLPG